MTITTRTQVAALKETDREFTEDLKDLKEDLREEDARLSELYVRVQGYVYLLTIRAGDGILGEGHVTKTMLGW